MPSLQQWGVKNVKFKIVYISTKFKLISSSNLCDFCNMDIETIQHLFWECSHVQIFWNNLHNFINNTYLQLHLTFNTVSFWLIMETDEDKL